MSHCHGRACSATPHKTTKRDGALVIPLVGSACNCACAECDEESVATGIRAPSPKEETIMEETQTTEENTKTNGWGGAVAASEEAAAADPRVVEAGTAELSLPCLLSDDEKIAKGAELADTHARIDLEEEDAKASATRHREKLKELYETASATARVLRAGKEDRRVACKILHLLDLGECRTIRNDTGEIVSERALDYSERQGKLKLDPVDADPADASLDGDDGGYVSTDEEDAVALTPLSDAERAELFPEGEPAETDITTPGELVGDEPAPPAKKAKRGKR